MDNSYKQKYLIYKKKYLELKSQKGGSIDVANINELDVANKIRNNNKNLGQNNCGVIFIDNYAIKCLDITDKKKEEDDQRYLEYIEKINVELVDFIPRFYKWTNDKLKNFIRINYDDENPQYAICIIMDKLDGDLTNYILRKAYFNTYNNYDNYDFFYERLPKTTINYTKIRNDTPDNFVKYNKIIDEVKPNIFELCNCLNIKLLKLHHNLCKKGWWYKDLKLDNIGYKTKSNGDIKLYFIDIESGLFMKPDKYNDLDYTLPNETIGEYSVLGQYNIGNIFSINFQNFVSKINQETIHDIIDNLKNKEINLIKNNRTYRQHQYSFIKSGRNNKFVIQYVQGFYRLFTLDDNDNYTFSKNYNQLFPKFDVLCYSLEELYKYIDMVYDY